MSYILTHFEIVFGVLITGTALIWVLQQRRSPQSALAWILFIVTVPYLGVPLFFLLGVRRSGAHYDDIAFGSGIAGPPVHPLDDQLRRLGVPPAAPGHRLELQSSSEAAHDALTALVAEAEHSLDVVLYRLDADKYGVTFARALTDAAKRGVRVRLILDQIGTWRRPRRALWKLRQAGGEIHFFSPFPRLRATGRFNLRNHRKMVLVDGRKPSRCRQLKAAMRWCSWCRPAPICAMTGCMTCWCTRSIPPQNGSGSPRPISCPPISCFTRW
ncbi:MAG: phospholipase D-like domain-containing protein [Maritimibacter sp.]